MKKSFFLLIAMAVSVMSFAQGDPGKDLKQVNRNLANYNLDPAANADALLEAATLIEGVVKSSEFAKDAKAWQAYGSVFAEHVNSQTQALVLDPEAPVSAPQAITKAYTGFKNALMYAEKSYEKKDALTGLQGVLPNMYYLANTIVNRQDLEGAYPAYNAVIEGEAVLDENGGEGIFTEEELHNAEFVTAVCAFSSGKNEVTLDLLNGLKEAQYSDAGVYEYLYKTYSVMERDEEATAALEAGRQKFPDDKGLLFAEINATLAKGQLNELVDKLKEAIVAEPENVTVPTTLGNVYDQMYQKALANDHAEEAHAHLDSARKYIQVALDINPKHFDAVYMMGALEYNRAAELASEMNALADDYSKEGTKKYEAKKTEMMTQFEKALPYFERAENINSKDVNTLIALREIWVRKGDFEKGEAYKAKLDAIQGN